MADLGAIATQGCETKATKVGNAMLQPTGLAWPGCTTKAYQAGYAAVRFRSLTVGNDRYVLGGEDFIQGSPAAPTLWMDAFGVWRFKWVLEPGAHTLQVNVLQAANMSPRPTMVIKSNPSIGLNADVSATAPSGAGWTVIAAPTVTATALGATWVELHNNLDTNVGQTPCYWDHLIGDGGNILCDFDVWLDGAPVVFQLTPATITTVPPTPTFMATKLEVIIRPVPDITIDPKTTPKPVVDSIENMRRFCREAERAFRAVEAAFNKATGN